MEGSHDVHTDLRGHLLSLPPYSFPHTNPPDTTEKTAHSVEKQGSLGAILEADSPLTILLLHLRASYY